MKPLIQDLEASSPLLINQESRVSPYQSVVRGDAGAVIKDEDRERGDSWS
jgi:hypothetical protein